MPKSELSAAVDWWSENVTGAWFDASNPKAVLVQVDLVGFSYSGEFPSIREALLEVYRRAPK